MLDRRWRRCADPRIGCPFTTSLWPLDGDPCRATRPWVPLRNFALSTLDGRPVRTTRRVQAGNAVATRICPCPNLDSERPGSSHAPGTTKPPDGTSEGKSWQCTGTGALLRVGPRSLPRPVVRLQPPKGQFRCEEEHPADRVQGCYGSRQGALEPQEHEVREGGCGECARSDAEAQVGRRGPAQLGHGDHPLRSPQPRHVDHLCPRRAGGA